MILFKIYIYGYGIWGHITADYFDYKGWKYEGFVTSDGIDEKAKRFNDIVLSEDDGIIIAQEYKHVCEQIINYMGERMSQLLKKKIKIKKMRKRMISL